MQKSLNNRWTNITLVIEKIINLSILVCNCMVFEVILQGNNSIFLNSSIKVTFQ